MKNAENRNISAVLGSCDHASWNVGWREVNQQDATNLMFIIKLLSQHVLGIIMPIIRRTRPCITVYGVLHCNRRGKNRKMWAIESLCGVMRSKHTWDFVCIHTDIHIYTRHTHTHTTIHTYTRNPNYLLLITPHRDSMAHILRLFPPPVTVQNTICSNTRSCSPDDGHNDARNMLR